MEKEVIFELNKLRSDPNKYAQFNLEPMRKAYRGKLFTYSGQISIQTKEGVDALDECIRVLKKTLPVQLLYPSEGLSRASADHVAEQAKNGQFGHIGKDGSNPVSRIERYGNWEICTSENISYGCPDAAQIVMALLIDDDVPDRGHRRNMLDPCIRLAGVSFGTHPEYETMCVMDFAGGFREN
jgi:uncharacterized protein YkwD